MGTVTISEEEYHRLKQLEKVDFDLVKQFDESLADLKAGRVRRVK